MSRHVSLRCVGILAGAGVLIPTFAFAQSTPPQTTTAWPPRWTVAAGVESFWLRDVARTGPPVDGSPISWEGSGPIVWISHDRGSRSRLHHVEGSFASAGGFELRSPIGTTPASKDDSVSRLSGRYEYRRYPWRDVGTNGLDLGIGVEGSGEHLSFDRHVQPDIDLGRSLNALGVAFVVAGRWERSTRWSLLAAWSSGSERRIFPRPDQATADGHAVVIKGITVGWALIRGAGRRAFRVPQFATGAVRAEQ